MAFRRGQWVKLKTASKIAGIDEPAGTVAIHVGPAMQANPEFDPAFEEDPNNLRMIPVADHVEVHLVDVPAGTTRRKVMIKPALLEPITSRKEIPADRLKTMAKEWQPLP